MMKVQSIVKKVLGMLPETAVAYVTFFILLNIIGKFSHDARNLWYIPFTLLSIYIVYEGYKSLTVKADKVLPE